MNTLLLQRVSWPAQVSRTSRQLSINLATRSSRRQHHLLSSPIAALSYPHSSLRASQAWSRALSTSAVFHQGEASNAAAKSADTPTETADLTAGFNDEPLVLDEGSRQVDWARSFHGLSTEPFPKEVADILLAPIDPEDVEVKPDGIVYLPEIKYRRILNKAFGPGAWGLAPRGETIVTPKMVTREYALVAHGRLISVARGEQTYFSPEDIPTATEGCKSSALRRCCKDLGIASELWDPSYIRKFAKERIKEVWVENTNTKKKKKISMLAGGKVAYPWKLASGMKE